MSPAEPEVARPPDASKDTLIRRRVLVGTLSNYAGRIFSFAAWFLLTPFLLRQLGATGYGLWVLVGSLVAYGWLLNFGIQGTITRYLAQHRARGEVEQARRLLVTSLWCDAVLGMLAIALSAAIAPVVPLVFNVPPDQRALTTWLVVLMGIGIGVTIPCETAAAALRGLHRYDLANLVTGLGTLLNVAGVLVVLLLGGGLLGVVAVSIPTTLATQALGMWLVNRVAPELRFGWRGADRRLVGTIIGFSWPLLLTHTASLLQRKTDEIVIAAFLPVSAVTPYALARRLSDLGRELTKQFLGVILPVASELDAERDTARLSSLYVAGTRLALAIFLPIGCTVTVLARPILTLWVGAAYADNVHLVAMLTLAGFMMTSELVANAVLQGMARHRPASIASFCSALANLALSVLLVRPLGLTGVALGTLIPTTLEYLVVMPYAARVIGVGLAEGLTRIWLPALTPIGPMVLVLWVVQRAAEPLSLLSLVAVIGSGFAVYAAGYLGLSATRTEREIFRGFAIGTYRLAGAYLRRT